MDIAQAWCLDIEEMYNKAEVHSINAFKLAYLGWGNSIQKANWPYNKHLFDKIKSHLINISDNYSLMKTWLITNYGGPVRIFGDIVSNLSRKSKPILGNRREKFSFYSAITGSIQRLERLSRVN